MLLLGMAAFCFGQSGIYYKPIPNPYLFQNNARPSSRLDREYEAMKADMRRSSTWSEPISTACLYVDSRGEQQVLPMTVKVNGNGSIKLFSKLPPYTGKDEEYTSLYAKETGLASPEEIAYYFYWYFEWKGTKFYFGLKE